MHNLSGKTSILLTTFGGLATYASPDSLPSGTSPRCHDVDFTIGGWKSRKGLANKYSFASLIASNLGSAAASETWSDPANAYSKTLYASASGSDSGPITVTQFAFSVSQPVLGIVVSFNAMCPTSCMFTVQLVQNGLVIGIPKVFTGSGPITLGSSTDLWGATPNINDTTFGVQIDASSSFPLASYYVNSVQIEAYLASTGSNFQYLKSFVANDGTIRTLAMDAIGDFWVANETTNPGVFTSLLDGLPSGAYAKSTTSFDREYIAFSNLLTGVDIPRQYNGQWVDRITQVGPGAPPQFAPQAYSGDDYPITSITQPAAASYTHAYFLRSTGPGSSSPGNQITFYYSDETAGGVANADLVTAFNSGYPVYLYISFTSPTANFGPYVVLVTGIGQGSPPGQPHSFYYFTFQDPTGVVTYTLIPGSEYPTATANFQRTLATLTTSAPVPGLLVGNSITNTGSSVSAWDNTFTVTETPNSGSFVITQTSVSGGVATYSWALSSGTAPVAGEQVTITGTTNADGQLNGNNLVITSASGSTAGTFTVNVSVADTGAAVEQGQATTAGTEFDFDPGAALLGTATNPIYGNATGGTLIYGGTSIQYIGAGTRQGVVSFGTRNDAETSASTPSVFTIPANTSTLIVSQIPIGPPNTLYRQIAITEAGTQNAPGGNFYTIDTPVTYVVNGVTYTSSSFRINDNTTTSVALTFRDSDLLSARAIDVQGQDLFNEVEIGNPAWITQYAGRMFYGLTQTKIQNFINLSFDGGYVANILSQPLGWSVQAPGGSLIVSPEFGNSFYIKNTTGATATTLGLITQSAYQDYYNEPILSPNVAYSVRVTARSPSGIQGTLYVDLSTEIDNNDLRYGLFATPTMTTKFQTYSGTLLAAQPTIPSALVLRLYFENVPAGGDVEIDRIEIFPTDEPINNTQLLVSYEDNPEGVDGKSGLIQTNSENTQPCFGAVVMYDLLYLLKDQSMYYTQDSSGDEPSGWGVHEVSNKAGTCGVNAYDSGEEWIVMANRNGVYLFTGGEPRKISQEVQQIWDAINWSAGRSIWLRNDVVNRVFRIGIPLPTPNFWLPNAPENAAPTFPNVILKCSYEGNMSGSEIADASPLFATQFGNLDTADMRRKWTLDQIPCPYADFIMQQNGLDAPLLYGNGISNSKIYELSATNDDGAEIPWLYTTYGFGDEIDVKNSPQLGAGRKRWSYWLSVVTGLSNMVLKLYSNRLESNYTYQKTISVVADDFDREQPLNIPGNRVYVEFSSAGINTTADMSQMTLVGSKDVFNSLRGAA